MFGYLVANSLALNKEEIRQYRSYYCGLCETLMDRYGTIGRKTLSYDLTFVEILLNSLYEGNIESIKKTCPIHPLIPRNRITTSFNDYCADMNILLTYFKLLDDANDTGKAVYRHKCQQLQPYVDRIAQLYPRQYETIEKQLKEIAQIEQQNILNPDAGMHCFGLIMAEILSVKEDDFNKSLRAFGYHLGRFIYLMDAVVDLKEDLKSQNYNPLVNADSSTFKSMLMMVMEECDVIYRQWPLKQDKVILDNIFYNGIWTRYHLSRKRKDDQK